MTARTNQKNPPSIFWIAVSLIAVIGAGWFVFDAATDKGIKPFYRILLVVIALGWLWVLWRIQPNLPRRLNSLAEWKKPKTFASALSVPFAVLSGLGGIVQIVSPRAATESKSGIIEASVKKNIVKSDQILAKINADQKNIARLKINGLWGETQDCIVAFRFKVDGKILTIDGERRPVGSGPFALVGNIQPDDPKDPNTISIVATTPVQSSGKREVAIATFTYQKNGDNEELVWADGENPTPATYSKCKVGN